MSEALLDRLTLTPARVAGMVEAVAVIAAVLLSATVWFALRDPRGTPVFDRGARSA